jgi:hypothetical protein
MAEEQPVWMLQRNSFPFSKKISPKKGYDVNISPQNTLAGHRKPRPKLMRAQQKTRKCQKWTGDLPAPSALVSITRRQRKCVPSDLLMELLVHPPPLFA